MASDHTSDPVLVVAGILRDPAGRILVSRRRPGTHLEHLWEFPGGKLEPGEEPAAALSRELNEELGIQVLASAPLLSVTHHYPDKSIRLWLYEITAHSGTPQGLEGQPLMWVDSTALAGLDMPAADRPVGKILDMPAAYAISPDPGAYPDAESFLGAWNKVLVGGFRLLRLRADIGNLPPGLLADCLAGAREHGARVVVSDDPRAAVAAGADGVHLSAAAAAAAGALDRRPVADGMLLGVSCHDRSELQQAGRLEADFVTVSPVAATASHPGASVLGWDGLADLVAAAPAPVYALGGVTPADLQRARAVGAWGVAGISAFGWRRE